MTPDCPFCGERVVWTGPLTGTCACTERVPKGWKRIGPGIYDTGEGGVHVDAPVMCHHFGVPATDENVRAIVEGAMQAADELGIEDRRVIE